MTDKIETLVMTPIKGQEDAQIAELVHFIAHHGQIVYNPIIFLQGWHTGKVKVITRRCNGDLVGVYILLAIPDPVTDRTHLIKSYACGEDLSEVALLIGEDKTNAIN